MKWQIHLWGAALALALGLGPLARGQETPGPAKHYYNKTSFRIPVVIDEKERTTLASLKLYVRQPPGAWVCASTGSADEKTFTFQAPRDGEYWFNIATVDREGRLVPDDLSKHDPALVVVVDTRLPDVEVKPMTIAGKVYLLCRLQDAHPDYSSIKIEYQAADGIWQPLDGPVNTPGTVQVPDPRMLDGRVRVKAADRAGNVCEREFSLNAPKVAGTAPVLKAVPPHDPLADAPGVRRVSDERLPAGDLPPPASAVVIPPATAVTTNKPAPLAAVDSDGGPLPPKPGLPDLASASQRSDSPQSAVINSTRGRLDFALESATGDATEVEVWASADGGRSWKPVGASKDGKSPAVVDFPGEGKYGIAFVVKSAAGLPSALPKPGEAPDGWLEVDTTLPTAELLSTAPGTGVDAGYLVMNWSARDANLGAEPISFWYANTSGGPWQLISDKLANASSHRWPLPKNVGSQIWVRMEVRDRAGNVTRCETPNPITLEGPRARGRVLGAGPARE